MPKRTGLTIFRVLVPCCLALMATAALATQVMPVLSINIPTIRLTDIVVKDVAGTDRTVDIPWLAQYVSGVYSYAIGIAGTLAGVMMAVGGFQYLTAGGDANRVKAAKQRITDAVIGAALVLGAYMVLSTINPELVSNPALRIKTLIGHRFEIEGNPSVPLGEGGTGGTGGTSQPGDPAVVDGILKASREVGVDPCTMLTICQHETGLTLRIWNGAPRNPLDKAYAFGPCGIVAANLGPGTPLNKAARARFPDYPKVDKPLADALRARGEWLMTNAEGSGFIAAKILKGWSSNEVLAIADYGAGGGSITRWQKANKCTPQSVRVRDMIGKAAEAIKRACIPDPPQYPTIGGIGDACAENDYNCSEVHTNSKAEFVGTCAKKPGSVCYTMDTGGFARYVINQYPYVRKKYPQCASAS